MKHAFRRGAALILALTLMLSLPLSVYASQALGSDVTDYAITLGKGTEYGENVFYGASIADLRQEHYVTYSPNSTACPVVGYGAAVTDLTKPTTEASKWERDGYRILMAMNGDFYNTANGVPLGMVVSAGELKSGSGDYYALGFTGSGKLITGKPQLTFTAEYDDELLEVKNFNKDREDDGAYLFSYDFNAKHSTGTTAKGTYVIMTLDRGSMAIGETVRFTVEDVWLDYTGAVDIEDEEHFVLTANENAPMEVQEALMAMESGETLKLSITASERKWESAEYATGALYMLLEDGSITDDATSNTGAAPRTALGVKSNGEIVFYTIDGRRSGYSLGASYRQVAQRLIELGCVEAYALDGGGSTVMATAEPGFDLSIVTRPSDGYERSVSTQILLVAKANGSSSGGGLTIRPASRTVLAGASVKLSAAAYDKNYNSLGKADAAYSASAGEIEDDIFIAPERGGDVTVEAKDGSRRGSTVIHVIDKPDVISVSANGRAVTSLALACGETVSLTASAMWQKLSLLSDRDCYTWTLSDGKLGSIEPDGTFTCGKVPGRGSVTVRAGEKSLTIPLTLSGGDIEMEFTDVEGIWAEEYIAALYKKGVVGGFDDNRFRPDQALTRKQFAAMLYRALGLDDADYAAAKMPFADSASLTGYAEIPVKALYSLGIVSGSKVNGKLCFRGGEYLTRAQAAAMLGRAYDLSQDGSLLFTDAKKIPDYAKSYISAMSDAGIIGGFADGSFRPQSNLTRAQMCKILYFAMQQAGTL